MKVADSMTREVMTLAPEQSLRDAMMLIQRHRIRHIPIVVDGSVTGMITDRDIRKATPSIHSGATEEEYERVLSETPVSAVMTRDPATVTPQTSIKEVAGLMVQRKYGALPVVDEGRLVGIISQIDLLRVLETML